MSLVYENDIFTAGMIAALKMILEMKTEEKTLDSVDFECLIEEQKRNINDPSMIDNIAELPEGGE